MSYLSNTFLLPRELIKGVHHFEGGPPFSAQDEWTLTSILDQTAIAIDRALLVGESIRAAALEENEKPRTTLLSSLSHDLGTQLASITGAVTSPREPGDKMSPQDRDDLLASIEEEAGRLTRFVKNLLDMSHVEAEALEVRRDWVDVVDAVRGANERARKAFPGQKVGISIAPNLPFIRADANLLQQVLFNLLDNAHKYGGGADAITRAPDIVLLDLGLPDMDGKEVIAQARAFSKIPIIVLSARDREAKKSWRSTRAPTILGFGLGA